MKSFRSGVWMWMILGWTAAGIMGCGQAGDQTAASPTKSGAGSGAGFNPGSKSEIRDNLKHIMLAMHNYEQLHSCIPAADGPGTRTAPESHLGKLSWRVYILPQLDEYNLYAQFRLDEPWDSEHNKKLIAKMPKHFGESKEGKTSYHMFVGPGTLLGSPGEPKFSDITDGMDQTLAVVVAGADKAEIWTKPGGPVFDPAKDPFELLGNFGEETYYSTFHGAVLNLNRKYDTPEKLKLLIQHRDGQKLAL